MEVKMAAGAFGFAQNYGCDGPFNHVDGSLQTKTKPNVKSKCIENQS